MSELLANQTFLSRYPYIRIYRYPYILAQLTFKSKNALDGAFLFLVRSKDITFGYAFPPLSQFQI
jgi:hypothetical protein